MISSVFNLFRSLVLAILVLVSVVAFLPDTVHLGNDFAVHEVDDHTHDAGSPVDLETSHCHSGVSCAGAMLTQDFAIPLLLWTIVSNQKIDATIAPNSLASEREPPVPILIA